MKNTIFFEIFNIVYFDTKIVSLVAPIWGQRVDIYIRRMDQYFKYLYLVTKIPFVFVFSWKSPTIF